MIIVLDPKNMPLNKFPSIWAVNLEVPQVAFMEEGGQLPTVLSTSSHVT